MENKVKCPKCNSTQITSNKQGYGIGKAVIGVVLTGGIGLLAGGIGSSNVLITCLGCGFQFKPERVAQMNKNKLSWQTLRKINNGEELTKEEMQNKKVMKSEFVFGMILLAILMFLFRGCIF